MKKIIISKATLLGNMKNNIKKMCGIVICGCLIGCIVGCIYVQLYSPSQMAKQTESFDSITLSQINMNEEYYFNAFYQLKQNDMFLNAYLQYLSQVDLSHESKAKLNKTADAVYNYEEDGLNEAIDFYQKNPLFVEGFSEETIEFYKNKIHELETYQEDQKEILKNAEIEHASLSNKKDQNRAEELVLIEQEISVYSSIQDEIRLHTNEPYLYQKKANEVLEINYEKMNGLINEFNETLDYISRNDGYEISFNKVILNGYTQNGPKRFCYKLNDDDIMDNTINRAIIYAKSIEGIDSSKEIFFATITFFFLFSIGVAFCVGSFHNSRGM